MDEIEWWVGFDWASEKHRACLVDAGSRVVGERDVPHGGDGLAEFCAWLLEKTGAPPAHIAVAIETPRGPVVEGLLERGFQVYAINPKQLDRFRDRFSVAGAKDDRRDAYVLGTCLRTDAWAFRLLKLDDPVIIELREWSRLRQELQEERQRLTNRMREQLWRYFSQALDLTDDLGAEWFLALWQQAPTPAKAARLRAATVERLLKAHRVRRLTGAEALDILRRTPLTVAPGTVEAASAHIHTLVARLRLVNSQLQHAHRRLNELCAQLEQSEGEPGQSCEQRDVEILRSLPGLGRIILAALLAEACEPLRQRDYHALRTLCGVAPVTKSSGKSRIVIRRLARDRRLAETLYQWARCAIQRDPTSKRRYAELRQRGHGHARALRTVADRLLFLACILLRRQTPFDPHYNGATQIAA